MVKKILHAVDPKRSEIARRNRSKRKGLSDEGRARLRAAALALKPWQYTTGPRTAAGKAQSAINGKTRRKGSLSVREMRAELADIHAVIHNLFSLRKAADEATNRRHAE